MTKDPSETWLADLDRDGYVVIPNVIPLEACKEYQEGALTWLESFDRGFKRDDPATWKTENLPRHFAGGMYSCHGVNHASWVWNIRAQPGIQEVFKKVWGDDDIIASFDACNVTLPVNPEARTDIEPTKPWPHIDQNPRLVHKRQEVQGIANLYPSGPDDGGLIVVKGSSRLHPQYFKEMDKYQDPPEEGQHTGGHFDPAELEWYLAHGAEIVKVCANEGDLILWDSRTIHWNCLPTGKQTRFATYVAYAPRSWMKEEDLQKKLETFRARIGTGHKAADNPLKAQTERNWEWDKNDGATVVPARPRDDPKETPEILWAVGVRS